MSSPWILVGFLAVFLGLAAAMLSWARKSTSGSTSASSTGAEVDNDQNEDVPGAARRGRFGMAAMRQRRAGGEEDEEEEEIKMKKIGKKKMEKLAMKEDKRQARDAIEQLKEKRKKEEEEREILRRQQDEDREAEQRAREEEEERILKEKKMKEDAEFDKWKDMFSVEVGGSIAAEEEQENQGLLSEFINYIQTRKIVPLDELGAHYQLRPQDVVSRVQALELTGAITGVLDDRGKFISITEEEMKKVANFINLRGRVSISEIATESNKLIDLKGSHTIAPPKGIQPTASATAPATA